MSAESEQWIPDPDLENEHVGPALYRLALALQRGSRVQSAAAELAFRLRPDQKSLDDWKFAQSLDDLKGGAA